MTETKITPKRITNNGHHRSSQDADSLVELIHYPPLLL
jgi:hypothetical protein